LKKILVDKERETLQNFDLYIKPLNIKKIIYFDGNALRIVKSNEEIKLLQKAADIVCDAINHIKKTIRIGETEIEVSKRLSKQMFANGASGLSFPPIVAFGINGANIHHIVSNRKLKKNEIILVDAGCIYEGYCSDITRC
jgi:Xaa-Pro aminopeptidase